MEFLLGLLLIPVWSAAFVRVKATQEATLLWTLAIGVEKAVSAHSIPAGDRR